MVTLRVPGAGVLAQPARTAANAAAPNAKREDEGVNGMNKAFAEKSRAVDYKVPPPAKAMRANPGTESPRCQRCGVYRRPASASWASAMRAKRPSSPAADAVGFTPSRKAAGSTPSERSDSA